MLALVASASPGTAQGQSGSTPPEPAGVRVVSGANPGEASILWNPAPGVSLYRVAWLAIEDFATNRANDGWRSYVRYSDVTADSSWAVDRLTSGMGYYFIVGARHSDGRIGWSRWETLKLNAAATACPTDLYPPSPVDRSRTFRFSFEDNAEGWTVGYADLPVDYDPSIYELNHGHRPLPDGLPGGIYIQGHNRSDDLFMLINDNKGGLLKKSA